jgi:hypothetical protein
MGTNWVFVDYRVEDRAVLLAGLGADCEWRLVGPDEGGLRQIRAALDGQRDVDSIRIIAHGRPGAILLGSTEIDGDTLARRDGELAQIGQVLAAGGDLQLYACEVGDGEAGRAFVDVLAEGLGVPVAASSTSVGHADLGGDWRLDVGETRTKPLAVPQWRGVLGLTVAGIPLRNTPERTTWEYRNENAFAVIRTDGSVVTWGYPATGGNSSGVADQLDGTIDVVQIFHGGSAFAALRADGSVVTWGDTFAGGNSSSVAGKLDGTIDVTRIASNFHAFCGVACRWLSSDVGALRPRRRSGERRRPAGSPKRSRRHDSRDAARVDSKLVCRAPRRWIRGDLGRRTLRRLELRRQQQRSCGPDRRHDPRDAGVRQ